MSMLRRALFALAVVAMLGAGGIHAASTTNFSDQWWVRSESGWGASVLQQADVLFVTLFVYDIDGNPTWLSSAAAFQTGSPAGRSLFAGDLYVTSGSYYGGPWKPGVVVYRKVGFLSFDAVTGNDATLTFTVDGTETVKTVTRTLWRHENLGGSYYGGVVNDQASCTLPADNGHFEAAATIGITHDANDSVTMRIVMPATGDDLLFAGTYSQEGHMGRIDATANLPSAKIAITVFEIENTVAGFTGRFVGSTQSSSGTCQITNGRIAGMRR